MIERMKSLRDKLKEKGAVKPIAVLSKKKKNK